MPEKKSELQIKLYKTLLSAIQKDLSNTLAADGSPAQNIIKGFNLQGPGTKAQQQISVPAGKKTTFGTFTQDTTWTFYSPNDKFSAAANAHEGKVGIMIYNKDKKPIVAIRNYVPPEEFQLSDVKAPTLTTIVRYDDKQQRAADKRKFASVTCRLTDALSGKELFSRKDQLDPKTGKNITTLYGPDRKVDRQQSEFLNNATWKDKEATPRQIAFLQWFGDQTPVPNLQKQSRGDLAVKICDYQTTYEILERDFTMADKIAFAQYSHKDINGKPDYFPDLTTYKKALDFTRANRAKNDYRKSPDDPEWNIAGVSEPQLKAALTAVEPDASSIDNDLQAIKTGAMHLPSAALSDQQKSQTADVFLNALQQVNAASKQPMDLSAAKWKDVRNAYLPIIEPLMKEKGYDEPKTGELYRSFRKAQKQNIENQIKQARPNMNDIRQPEKTQTARQTRG